MMPKITLPDGSERSFPNPVTVREVAESIGAGLARAAIAAKVDNQLVDVSHSIQSDTNLQIITEKDPQALEIIRHSTAHLLAHAVKQLFPGAQVTIGPVIEDGFYYDFAYERSFTPEDLEKIEAKMTELAQQNFPVVRKVLSREEAVALFTKMGEHYKVQIINDIPGNETLTAYEQGDFIDLCRGPHVPQTGHLKAFKLTKLAGAYWRGDSKNQMLQRIYGTAWADKKALQAYLHRLEEAEKRDHRKLAKKMNLFHFQPEAPGMVFWHPAGWTIVRQLRNYLRDVQRAAGYLEVQTPQLVEGILWEKSGHKAKFDAGMFSFETDGHEFILKPMNCPCHVQIFNQGIRSYRDLPVRYSEFGSCHRFEPSGTLHGLMRLRNFVQDDGHIFCTEDQIQSESIAYIEQLHAVYKTLGFEKIIHRLSTRPEKRVGSDEAWDKAEQALANAMDALGVEWQENPGEGAFYGPKIEFSLHDCIGRVWQCGTLQVDFNMAERLDATYVDEEGNRKPPVMLHRAIFGSIERFLGILLEEYEGKLPLWLAPVQVVVMHITDPQIEYAKELTEKLQKLSIRAEADLRNEKIGFKIRQHAIARVPYQLILGDREVETQTVSVRQSDTDKTETMTFSEFVDKITQEIEHKRRN
jgi:threonyl-tRNA synthetase